MKNQFLESKKIERLVTPVKPLAGGAMILFPELGWNLKKAGYKIDAVFFLSVAFTAGFFLFSMCLLAAVFVIPEKAGIDFMLGLGGSIIMGVLGFMYVIFLPSLKVSRSQRGIDKNLEYMLKDMEIQLTAGIPLFDIFVNTANGEYGECSVISRKVVEEVQSGKAIINVLDEYGMLSPSEYLRRVFWQIVNALKTGSNVGIALKMISKEIREEKENSITTYAQELGLLSLIYMIMVIILPSMGITLMLILSSLIGGGVVTEVVFWVILLVVIFFQFIFISIIKSKRPDV